MSHYVTPFLVFNLGCETIFVVAQRLEAQNIPHEQATIVLEEIVSALISKQLITDLMKPQTAYSHDAIREIIEGVVQVSAMRLDPVSMGKLWDLITMVYKWQVSISQNIIKITLRHLYEIETYVTNQETQLQLHKVQNLIDNFNKILLPKEKNDLYHDTCFWLRDFNVRVSLLLRMGLQSMDGHFIINNLDPIADEMLKNLGENIYAVTQNGKVLEGAVNNNKETEVEVVNELQLFVNEMLGERKLSSGSCGGDGNFLKLSIDCEKCEKVDNGEVIFDKIDVSVEDSKLDAFMSEMNVNEDPDAEEEENSFRNDLLDLIGVEDE